MKLWRENHTTCMEYWGNTWKIPWYDQVHHCWFQQRVLDGGATPRFQEIDDHGSSTLEDSSGPTFQWVPSWHRILFQRKLDAIFLDVPGVTGIADDMIIFGKTDQEHDGNLLNFLEVCRKNNLTLNPRRCSSDFQKFPSLATPGATKVFQLTQRR